MACTWRTQRLACMFSHSQLFLKRRTFFPRLFFEPMSGNSDAGTSNNSTHLERTESLTREEIVSQATVTEIIQRSETVKGLCLKVEDNRFTFKPGQWVDFFIPGISTVGGYSICSTPKELKERNTIELAVKESDHPPALWVHTKCSVGSKVQMRVGGSFFFDPRPGDLSSDLILIAGGVGINPLYSIVQHVADCISRDFPNKYTGKTILLFSAKNVDELLFKDSLLEISKRCPSILCKFFTTKPETCDRRMYAHHIQSQHGRINKPILEEATCSLDRSNLTCYICGPPPMIKNMSDILHELNIAEDRIQFEKWW